MKKKLLKKNYDTDKNELYLNNYETHFSDLNDKKINLLEIGIYKGGSLLMWRDYFEKGNIIGLDINQVDVDDESGRISTYRGFQQDLNLLDQIRNDSAKEGFDVIIDDASHIGETTSISFWHLFEHHLKPGGIFVIEDWRTGYSGSWFDGKSYNQKNGHSDKRNRVQKYLDKELTSLLISESATGSPSIKRRLLTRLRNLLTKKELKSHQYGMVGFVKQLVDEMGMDAITNPYRGSTGPVKQPGFSELKFYPGQVFVIKSLEQEAL